MLNGRPVRLFGISRHQMHPDYGFALPPDVIQGDVDAAVLLGVNMLFTTHYAQDPRLLDLCDEAGLLVWQENLGVGANHGQMTDTLWWKYYQQGVVDMIEQHGNHASGFVWGYFDEGDDGSPANCQYYRAIRDLMIGLDPSRLASCEFVFSRLVLYVATC